MGRRVKGRGSAYVLAALLLLQIILSLLPVGALPTIARVSPPQPVVIGLPSPNSTLALTFTFTFPNGTSLHLNLSSLPPFLSHSDGKLVVNTSLLPLGVYEVRWGAGAHQGGVRFVLDEIRVEAEMGDGEVVIRTRSALTDEPIDANLTLITPNGTVKARTENGSAAIKVPPGGYNLTIVARRGFLWGEISVSLGGSSGTVIRTDRELYFPGDVVVVTISSPPPSNEIALVYPDNSTEIFPVEASDEGLLVRIPLNSSVMLGRYEIHVGNESTAFYVDYYELNASYSSGLIRGRVSFYYVEPDEVEYRFSSGRHGRVRVVNGTFSIPVPPDEREVELRCGNAVLPLVLEGRRAYLERGVYFPGDAVVVKASFEPVNATLTDPMGREVPLKFERVGDHWESEYILNTTILLGNYSIDVDGIDLSFVVDSYRFELAYDPEEGIVGRVYYQIVPPTEASYWVEGLEGNVSIVDGAFSIPVTLSKGEHKVVLKVWGRKFDLMVNVSMSEPPHGFSPEVGEEYGKIVAYDPVSRTVVIKSVSLLGKEKPPSLKGIKALKKIMRRIGDFVLSEYELPADPGVLKSFKLPEDVLNTRITVRRVNATLISLRVENKSEVWYRFSVKVPEGYRVKEIVRSDGRRIVNDLRVDRKTGRVEGDLRWYIQDGILYFFDDPIYGYDITLTPPAPNNSIAIEEVDNGQISAIVFPYSEGDDSSTVATYDHAGRTGDNYANEIDADAGSKIAIRYTTPGGTRQYGNGGDYFSTADNYLTQISRENVSVNTVPNGVLESVIITEMQAQWSGYELNITQKTIIRDNNKWFVTVYYLRNPTSNTYTNLRFFQGMDWNFRGSHLGDDALYDPANDVVYGNDTNAPPGDIQYGGFRGEARSTAHDVNWYGYMWNDIYNDDLNNNDFYEGDAGTALAWDRDSLAPGEVWVVPVVWGLGYTLDDMFSEINDGLLHLHDVGVLRIDSPENGSRINPNVNSTVWVNATVALYGVVDKENVPVKINVEKIGGGYSSSQTAYVSLYVPHNETSEVSFSLDVSTLQPGAYNVTVTTELVGDQNSSNDAKSIVIYITTFSVEPDQEEKVYPGSEAGYNITAYNYDEEARFDVSIVQSTKGWATELYEDQSLIAEDSDGDGTWDFIALGYDTNGNGLPDILLPLGEKNLTVRKIVPPTAPFGEVDHTELNFSKIGDPSVYDTVSLYTDTIHPGNVQKQFYLHGDALQTLNTTAPTSAVSETSIPPNSLDSWSQRPAFADEFVLSGDVTVTLYLRDDYSATHDVAVDLLYTDGSTVTTIGSVEQTLTLSTTPEPYAFVISLTEQVTIPRGSYLVLRVENQAPYTLYVAHDDAHPSDIDVSTYTYIKVVDASSDKADYQPGETITITANVTDPIGAYDISEVTVTVFDQSDSLVLSDLMNLVSEDPSSPPCWRLYSYSFSLSDYGAYTVVVKAVETNGVTYSYNMTVYVSWPIQGRVYEDFGVLGVLDAGDVGIPNVRVLLYRDDGDGILDFEDKIIDAEITDSTGRYVLHSIHNGRVFVVVDSRSLISVRGLNDGHSWDEVWAEQTFQREWNGASWEIVPKFGGRDPNVGDMEYGQLEHYVTVDPSYYDGESVDFGFSYEVVVNTLDRLSESARPIGEVFRVPEVGSSWTIVFTHHYYDNPVVVCTYNLPSSSDNEAVVRLKDVGHYSFKLRLQNPSGKPVTPGYVYCMVMEEGKWELDDGRKVEAHRVVSDGTNDDDNWDPSLMEKVPYEWSYTSPVVLGQVMSYNDGRWSVFWDSNGDRRYPPDSTDLYVGKHVGEDPVTYREEELLGVIVVEAGAGTTGGISYVAQVGPDSVGGVGGGPGGSSPPYTYDLGGSYAVGVVTQSAMDGVNGGWAVLYGSDPISSELKLAIDEDTLSDSERWHTSEQVAYWVFEEPGPIYAKVDTVRYAQGSLRQFIANANALKGYQRSYFVMMVEPGVTYPSGKVWRISLNSSLGPLDPISDPAGTSINGTVFNEDLNVNDTNSGTAGSSGHVGLGPDGILGTGDECPFGGFSRPEIEIYGGGNFNVGLNVSASNTWISNLSIFGFGSDWPGAAIWIELNGGTLSNITLKGLFVGATATGERPNDYGLEGNGYVGIFAYYKAKTDFEALMEDLLVSYNKDTGIYITGGEDLDAGDVTIRNVESAWNGFQYKWGDGISVEDQSFGVVINCSFLHHNAAYGFDSWYGEGSVEILNSNITSNGQDPYQGEDGGIRLMGNNSIVNSSIIYDNPGPSVVIVNWPDGTTKSLNNSILINSIFDNGEVGIDLDATHYSGNPTGDNVTLNDGALNSGEPNGGLDYPVITDFVYDPGSEILYVSGFINSEDANAGSPTFAGTEVLIYLVNNTNGGDDLTGNDYSGDTLLSKPYGEGWIYLGKLIADSNGEFSGTLDLSPLPDWARPDSSSALTAVSYRDGTGSSEFGPDFKRRPVDVSVRKYLEPSDDCELTVKLSVVNHNPWPTTTVVYDVIPDGMVMSSPSAPPSGSSGNVHWWTVHLGPKDTPSGTRNITYTLESSSCGSSDYNLSDALIVGIDPPSNPEVDVKEYVDVRFHPDGSYDVLDHWGFLTVRNPTSDVISGLELDIDASGYTFYPDYPVPSSTPADLPLKVDEIRPGDYVRWRFTGPLNITPPLSVRDELTPDSVRCGETAGVTLRIRVRANQDVDLIELRKPLGWTSRVLSLSTTAGTASISDGDALWEIGSLDGGEAVTLVITANVRITDTTSLPDALVLFNLSRPPLLEMIRSVRLSGPASVQIEKQNLTDTYRLRTSFTNEARDLTYNLTSICIYEGYPTEGRLVACDSPKAILAPGSTWTSPYHEDTPVHRPPAYYARANFTVLFDLTGSYSSLRRVGDSYEAAVTLEEPELTCSRGRRTVTPPPPPPPGITSPPPPTSPVGGRIPPRVPPPRTPPPTSPTETEAKLPVGEYRVPVISLEKTCSPHEVEVGDLVTCKLTVANIGNATARDLTPEDIMPQQLVEASSGDRYVRWKIATLSPGESRTFNLTLQAVKEGTAVNIAVLSDLVASDSVIIRRPVRPSLRKYAFYMGEGLIRYLIFVKAGESVNLTDILPEGTEFLGIKYQGSEVRWSLRDRVLDIHVGGNGTAAIYVDTYYFDWMRGGKLMNRIYVAGGPEASAIAYVTGLRMEAYMGTFIFPPLMLIVLLLVARRRKEVLVDFLSLKELIHSGTLPSGNFRITESAFHRAAGDPFISSIVDDLLRSGRMSVELLDEETSVRALQLAKDMGIHIREAADIVVMFPEMRERGEL